MQAPLLLVPNRASADINMTDLSDQTLMEALIEKTSDEFKKPFQHPSGRYLPVCRWPGVKCNGRRQVVKIDREAFPANDKGALLEIAYLPLHISNCCLPKDSDFYGTVLTQALPSSLRQFHIYSNSFHGEFDFRHLPAQMEMLNISHNRFCGSCNLTKLPKHLCTLYANENLFSGSIALEKLPISLRVLFLSSLPLHGKIKMRNLPHVLFQLNLMKSGFFGEISLDYLPENIAYKYYINLSHNRLCGSIHAAKLPSSLERLDLRNNEFTGVAVINIDMLPYVQYDNEYITGVANANGKVYKQMPQDYNDLPHMMAFIDNLDSETKRMFLKRKKQPLPLKLWKGFEFDSLMRVTRIKITEDTGYKTVKGRFDFDKLPRMVTSVEISGYEKTLGGGIRTKHLPKLLRELKVPKNCMQGDFKLERLPMSLVTLDVSLNYFKGPVALDQLPIHMEILDASVNCFGGTLNLTSLPKTLRDLNLRGCLFKGTINLNLLPACLEKLDLRKNNLDGRVRMTRMPPSLICVVLSENDFVGKVVVARDVPCAWSTHGCRHIEGTVDTDGVPYSECRDEE